MTLEAQLRVDHIRPSIGAEISGVDLFRPLSFDDLAVDRHALSARPHRGRDDARGSHMNPIGRAEAVHASEAGRTVCTGTAQDRARCPGSRRPVSA